MSLEDRVETLEHELKILKNEIESTLLEIQNQVLIHYYPAFRAEEPTPARDLLPFVNVPPKASEPAQRQEKASSRAGMDVDYTKPKTREVSLDAIVGKANATSPLVEPPTRFKREVVALDEDEFDEEPGDETVDPPATTLNPAALAHLARWVNESVEKIGKDRTQELIDSSTTIDQRMPAVQDALTQLLELGEEEEPPSQVTTKDLLDMLMKLNKVIDQVAKVTASA